MIGRAQPTTRGVRERLLGLCLVLALAAFALPPPATAKPAPAVVDQAQRIVAVGDVHGDFDQYRLILRDAGIIDKRDRWAGGRTHFVQLGDIPDRGPDTREIIAFLQRLQREARRRRGAVHVIIGNHEAMNMYGDFRYVHPGEYAAFVTRNSRRIQQMHWKNGVEWIKANNPEEEWPEFDDAHREAWFERYPAGFVEHAQAWAPDGEIGKWVLENNAVMRIGDTLFVHGGLGPTYVDATIDEINEAVRTALAAQDTSSSSILRTEDGPLWYRGLARNPEATERPHLEALLANFGVKRIVVGHTPQRGAVVPRFGGRVLLVDVGLSKHYGHGRACVLIEDESVYTIHRGRKVRIPTGGPEEVIDYLKTLAAIDPEPSPLSETIRRYEKALEESEATTEGEATGGDQEEEVPPPAPAQR